MQKELIQFELPEVCPYCGTKLQFDGTHLVCTNDECEGKKLYKFIDGVNLLKIKGIGPAMIEDWFKIGFESPFDLLDTDFELQLNSMKLFHKQPMTKNEEKAIFALSLIKSLNLYTVIMMMGYKNVGKSSAIQIAKKYAGCKYDFTGLEKEVVSGWGEDEEKGKELEKILQFFSFNTKVEIIFPEDEPEDVKGLEFTGSPKPLFATKSEFEDYIKKFGFKHTPLKDAVMLVTDSYSSTSSKMATAKKKGVEIVTYEDFVKRFK